LGVRVLRIFAFMNKLYFGDLTGGTLTPLRRGGFIGEFGGDEDGGAGVRLLFARRGRRKSGGKIVH
jgi:hypothetical protein